MAQYPIKMLKDENGTPFVPLVAPEAVKDNQGTNWQALIDKKLEKTNIIAGDNITLSVSGNDITINSQAGGTSDYTALSNKPSLDTTSDVSLNPLKEEINGEISLHKIAKTGNYEDLLYKPIIPITFTDNMESDYSISKLPGWQVDLLQKMIDEYVKDNKSINNYILKADGIMFLENYAIGNLNNKYSTKGKNTRLYTFKKCGPYGSIPHAFQFVGPTSLSYNTYPESGYGVIGISNEGILIYCDNNYRVTEVCQRYKLYDEAEKNTNVSIEVVPTNLSRATAYIPTKDYQPATKKYVDDNKVSSNEITAILDEYGTKQNLKVGDDLTGKTISYAFPDNIEDNIAEGEQIIISTSTEDGDHHVILVSSNTLKYRYIDTSGSPYTQNLCTISNGATGDISYNFGFAIQEIDTSNYLYPYLFFKEDPLLSRIETLETNSAKETSKLTIRLDINGPNNWKVGTDNIEINYTNEDGRFISEKWYPTDIMASGEDKIINIAKGTVFTITSTYNMTSLTEYGECTNVQPLYKNTSSTEITCFIYKDGKVRFWDGETI